MLLTIPATAPGTAPPISVLDLDQLLGFVRESCPDAVSLMPPLGADDQPNGAALLAMKGRLETEGAQVVGGCYVIPESAPVADPKWQAETLFEARGLLTALEEGGIGSATLVWQPRKSEAALLGLLDSLAEDLERAGVRLAVQAPGDPVRLARSLRSLSSTALGVCCDVREQGSGGPERIRKLGETLAAVRARRIGAAGGEEAEPAWDQVAAALREICFDGPILIEELSTPAEYRDAIGFFRILLPH